jgi:hypothetical protein
MLWLTAECRFRDYWLAHYDEHHIEIQAYPRRSLQGEVYERLYAECGETLRRLDELIVNGTYEDERATLAKQFPNELGEPLRPSLNITPDMLRAFEIAGNYTAGLRSPDPDQRRRFERFGEATGVGSMTPGEALPLIAPLEKAKRPAGRKRHELPWQSVASQMSEMRLQVMRDGKSIPVAACEVAQAENQAQWESRAKLFDKRYRAKMRLRELGKK